MKKILIPVDGSPRSKKSVELAKKLYLPGEVSIRLLMVREDYISPIVLETSKLDPFSGEPGEKMREIEEMIQEYNPRVSIVFGYAAEKILEFAADESIDTIIMTKSTKKGWLQTIGSVTTQVVKYAPCMVLIVPEI